MLSMDNTVTKIKQKNPLIINWQSRTLSVPRHVVGIVILSIIYTVGLVCILMPIFPAFIYLTPINLLFSLGMALLFHQEWSRPTALVLFLSYVVGFLAEWFGVQTGLLFGDYHYGPVLGPRWQGTPFMIGINWAMLVYCSGVVCNHVFPRLSWIIRGIIAALLMVALDLLIEPVAMEFNFWQWADNQVPLQNYIGWFLVALPLTFSFAYWQGHIRNKVAIALFIWQFVFFLVNFFF